MWNDIFGNTIIAGCKISQLNSSAAAFKQLSPGLAGKYEVKINAYSSSVHKPCSFYNIYFSIEQKKKSIFFSLSVITAKNEKENQVDITVRIRYLAI